jgi:bifunctional non-homologous end joining protein LigD
MPRNLDDYNRMRDFSATSEPAADKRPRKKTAKDHALQFCIQKHDASHLHYDFRLELEGALKSWAVPKGPSLDPSVKRLAVHVEDHPLAYATFEGSIPEGHYGAGEVIVWDRGIWIPLDDPVTAYAKGRLKFELQGEKLGGLWNLVRTHMPGKQEQWFLIKHRDGAASSQSDYDVLSAEPDSVLSNRSIVDKPSKTAIRSKPTRKPSASSHQKKTSPLTGARKARLPALLKPELATLVEKVPDGPWSYEIKFDGYRIMARIDHGEVKLITRNGHDWTHKLSGQARALAALGLESAWLDGEVVVTGEQGVPDFQALQNAFEADHGEDILYYLFDLPYLNGVDLREVPVEERRAALATVLKAGDEPLLRFSESFGEEPRALLDSACQMHMEGLIGKRLGSPYVSRRSSDWIKLKCQNRQEFVIVGFTEPKGSRQAFGALLLGLHDRDGGELRYAGKVGTGFNEATLRSLHEQLKPLQVKKPPVVNPPGGSLARDVHWLKPKLLAEVAFAEMTRDGSVRHAVFHGLRNDKPARAITEERAITVKTSTAKKTGTAKPAATEKQTAPAPSQIGLEQGKVRITHPDRVIDPGSGITKLQLAQYYASVAEWILPELKDRPVALVRAPDGIAGELFFQKNAEHLAIPGITTLDKQLTGQPMMLINNVEALVGAVQMSTVELHTWNATSDKLDKPDRFVLDLDPDPTLPWKRMVEATQLTLSVLDELGLKAFLKTSGGKGIHVVVPLTRKLGWDEVKDFSHAIVSHMAKLLPERFSAVSGPKNRVGRIFIDYLRNGLGATTICAYAVRTREGLPVSMPIWREEVAELKGGNQWNLHNVHGRLAEVGDGPWADMPKTRQTITARMRRRVGMNK